jgi:uncharacterized RDD family membrane protein YckC
MSFGEDASASVAPPGFIESTAPAAARVSAVAVGSAVALRGERADAAVRWRIGAAFIDNVIVYGGYVALGLMLHWRIASLQHLWLLVLAGIAYHFAWESRDGQTPGKRRYGIRVVAVDGGAAGAGPVAIRSLLRVIDQLPVCYVSGLVSMVRTGPARRQRIGDVVGGTMVVAVDGHSVRGTPGWMLPTATILAVIVSAASAFAVFSARTQALTDTQRAEFIAGCESTPSSQFVGCGCVLNELQAAGYDTLSTLRGVFTEARSEALNGALGTARTTISNAVAACRR